MSLLTIKTKSRDSYI